MIPRSVDLYCVPFYDETIWEEKVAFWRDVHGIDMSAMMPLAAQDAFGEPEVDLIGSSLFLRWVRSISQTESWTVSRFALLVSTV